VLNLDLGLQADLTVRLLIATLLGAIIGVEREIHAHPAGVRTHLLVSLGSALFTVLSIYGFGPGSAPAGSGQVDPTRIAAQIVSGIGFLGAGAILKYGTAIRGLTTAASLWSAAAVGMAAGAGQWLLASIATAIMVVSLGPLSSLMKRLRPVPPQTLRLRLDVGRLDALGDISRLLADRAVDLAGVTSQRIRKNRYELELDLRVPPGARAQEVIGAISSLPDVDLIETASLEE
jgi:putative Mg2+ transporter-C (MgtC) family protein